ncbi:hypothetical protein TPHA_0A03920 [Tetrapisispora phaffii CBS 4417]|uniref:Peptide hydrolase n=1 Tax=Tetrapisispora phaffii (strain ATCC 24235 / CBS 4417 / NBRC 1672 / NRRL Y-8282 / UCD 70-5) TaxID=1071381 RepID=G8BNJ0_TETPH|nr:hypothetical protein TPHA_0A03920 [Tetrapisispora phaffii CBS 4417]CCE61468.1 hypothetical protein TPHA_0A03920 [Tetrapisispora phaffii CBS 4417]
MIKLGSVFRFRKTSLSFFLGITYFIIGTFYFYDQLKYKHNLPKNPEYASLLNDAWLELQNITNKPHPYNSKENDRIHDYLLHRIQDITSNISYAAIADDHENGVTSIFKQQDTFNASSIDNRVIYFESSNIVVRLEGSNPDLPELLLSAHYDAVPTSYGATDDGKGICSILAVLDYFSKQQPERGLVFNFNNNEEFGLLGSTIFMENEWAKYIKYFINLEGTGSGGKAVLFRTSDATTAKIYKDAVVDSPFGNSIYQEGFYNRYIHSETDYKVYEENGLRGWDIAFYKPRDLYHTVKDSIEYTSKEALWHMLHTTLQLTKFLALESINDIEAKHNLSPAVYFDVSGLKFFAMSSKNLVFWNYILLLVSPLTNICLLFIIRKKNRILLGRLNTWFRLPISLMVSCLITYCTSNVLKALNPFILSSNYVLATLLFVGVFLISNYIVLNVFERLSPTLDFKTVAINEVSVLLWAILFIQNTKSYYNNYKNTGIYPLTISYAFVSFAGNIAYLFMIFKKTTITPEETVKNGTLRVTSTTDVEADPGQPSTYSSIENGSNTVHLDNNTQQTRTNESGATPSENNTEENDERRPLLRVASTEVQNTEKNNVANYDWLLEFLIIVPIPTYIIYNSVSLIMSALNQTFQDTGDIAKTYLILLAGAIFIVLPVLPFAYKINFKLMRLVIVSTIIIFVLVAHVLRPFTEALPLKIRYIQVNDQVELFGIRNDNNMIKMIEDLPSVKRNNLSISCVNDINLTEKCQYMSVFEPHLIDNFKPNEMKMLDIEVIRNDKNEKFKSPYEPINAEIKINVLENRMCTLNFNTTTKVRQVTVFKPSNKNELYYTPMDSNASIPYIFKTSENIDQLQLHKLDFKQNYYHIGIQWLPQLSLSNIDATNVEDGNNNTLIVDVECFWGEYFDDSIDNDGERFNKLPSLTEILKFKPIDISITNKDKGLIKYTQQITL